MSKKLLTILGLVAAMAAPLKASTVIDSFNDVVPVTNTTALVNGLSLQKVHGGGVGWTGGFSAVSGDYEQSGTGVVVLYTNDQVVALSNYVSGQAGARHFAVAAVTTSSGTARRAQTRHAPTLYIANTIWFSCVVTLLQTNGDAGLLFNPNLDGSGTVKATGLTGFRVGLGSVYAPGLGSGGTTNRSGSLGIGPIAIKNGSGVKEGDNSTITNWTGGVPSNGAVIDHAVPTNGTPGLVLGCIYYDPNNNNYPRMDVWYNPDVTNEASLPAPTITYTDTNAVLFADVSDVGFQVVRSSVLGRQNEVIDNVKLSDETNGFDIVYLNAPLPTPLANVTATVPVGSEVGPTNLVFTISLNSAAATPVTVYYTLSGTSTNGFDGAGFVDADYTDTNFNTGSQTSSVTIPTGQSNAVVTLFVLNDGLPEGSQSVIFTVQNGTGYIVGQNATATGTILKANNANVSLQYMFEASLAPQVWDTNLVAEPAVTTGIGGASFDSTYEVSYPDSFLIPGNLTTNNEADAVADGNYMGLTMGPVLGKAMTLTNLQFEGVYGNPYGLDENATGAVIVVRSSLDNFTSDLTNFVLLPDNLTAPIEFANYSLLLGSQFSNLTGAVEFRLYFYDDTDYGVIGSYAVGMRVDNLYISGSTFNASAGVQRVSMVATIANAALPSTAGQFTITRTGDPSNPLTVYYNLSGTAGNGSEYATLTGSVTIPAGQTNVNIPVTPLDDGVPEPARTVVLTLANNTNYGILLPASDTVTLAPNNDLPGLVTYFFDEDNNGAASLAAAAAGETRDTNEIVLHNAAAGSGLGLFGANGGSGVGNGYATSSPYEGPSSLYVNNDYLPTDINDAVSGNQYISFTLSPAAGYGMTLTNFSGYVAFSGVGQTDTVDLRSSADNFTSDLGIFNVPGTSSITWIPLSLPMNITNNSTAGTEFRLYLYTTQVANTIFRLDVASFQGFITAAPATPALGSLSVSAGAVTINFTAGAGDASTAFTLQSSTNVAGPYVTDNSAVFTGGGGTFQVTTTSSDPMRFYRIYR